MEIQIIEGDLLETSNEVIIHQVNCYSIGSGVALALINKWPIIKEKHSKACSSCNPDDLIGKIQPVKVNINQCVINLFSQKNYGYDGKMYTSYDAVNSCLKKVKDYMVANNFKRLALPYKMCSCRGGANWNVIMALIKANFEDSDIKIEIYKLDKD